MRQSSRREASDDKQLWRLLAVAPPPKAPDFFASRTVKKAMSTKADGSELMILPRCDSVSGEPSLRQGEAYSPSPAPPKCFDIPLPTRADTRQREWDGLRQRANGN